MHTTIKPPLFLIPVLLLAGPAPAWPGHPFTAQTLLIADATPDDAAPAKGMRKAKTVEAEVRVEALPRAGSGDAADPEVNLDEIMRRVEAELRSALQNVDAHARHIQADVIARTRDAAGKARDALAAVKANPPIVIRSRAQVTDADPELVVTRPLSAEARAEWEEDLRVMDKLLTEVVNPREEPARRMALGIPLWLSDRSQPVPMYVQDYGALFRYSVDFPLAAGAEATPGKNPGGAGGSAWDRAKREIHSSFSTNAGGWGFSYSYSSSAPGTTRPTAPYDAAKVDALMDGVMDLLPEARNIRHLGEREFVTVTIAGEDEQGKALRLTLRAARSDLEQAASGKLSKEEFRKRVARQLN